MSLINQVLKDLEQRQRPDRGLILPKAAVGHKAGSFRRWFWIIAGLLVVMILAAGIVVLLYYHHVRSTSGTKPFPNPVPFHTVNPTVAGRVQTEAGPVVQPAQVAHSSAAVPVVKPLVNREASPPPTLAQNDNVSNSKMILKKNPGFNPNPKHQHQAPVKESTRQWKHLAGSDKENRGKPISAKLPEKAVLPIIRPVDVHEESLAKYKLGIKEFESGQIVEALGEFQRALVLNPNNAPARQALSNIYIGQRQYTVAQNLLEQGLLLQPGLLAFSYPLAGLLVQQGENAKALQVLNEAEAEGSSNADFFALRAAILMRLHKPAQAVQDYRQALTLDPNKPSWLVGLGIAYEANHDEAGARDAYLEAQSSQHLSPVLSRFVHQRLARLSNG
ncbi:MAG: tetratricopeptide repeat protein [Proteobacteria bacterium]|nr:tetratricopeptide repeat protein [Pseudomonadota bacterium]